MSRWIAGGGAATADLDSKYATKGAYTYARDHGLATNGTAAANTTALQAAIAEAIAQSRTLVIPGGSYQLNGLTIPNRLTIVGAGRDRTILNYVGTGTFISNATPGVRLYEWNISNLTLSTTNGAIGLDLDSISTSHFYNLKLNGWKDVAVYIHSTVDGGAVYNRFFNVTAQSSVNGFRVRGSSSNANVWVACRGNLITGICWDIQDCNDNTLSACQAESSGTAFFLDSAIANGAGWNRYLGCRIEHCTDGLIINSANVTDTKIDGLWVDGSTTTPITDNGTRTRRAGDLMSARVTGSVVALDPGWQFVSGGGISLGSTSAALAAATNAPLYLRSNAANAAATVGTWIGNGTTLTTAGARIAGFSKDSPVAHAQPVSYVGIDGSYEFASGVKLMEGAGSPEGVVAAPVGSMYLRRDGSTGTSLYRKESGTGNTGWVSATSGGGSGVASDDPPAVSGTWTMMSGRPYPFGVTTSSMAKDIWRFVPCRLGSAINLTGLTVETTVAASGGTAALIFSLYSVGSDGRPGALLTDLSSLGSIDLTTAVGVKELAFASTQFPAGEFFIACAWTGTATTAPTVRVLSTSHPRIVDAAPGVTGRSGYLLGASGATPPASPVVSTTATAGLAHFGKRA